MHSSRSHSQTNTASSFAKPSNWMLSSRSFWFTARNTSSLRTRLSTRRSSVSIIVPRVAVQEGRGRGLTHVASAVCCGEVGALGDTPRPVKAITLVRYPTGTRPARSRGPFGREHMVYQQGAALPMRQRPRLRGVLHEVAFFVALAVGVLLVTHAEGARASTAAGVFAGSVALMLGASALYHRVTWSVRTRPWMRRLDHAGIYLLIAGTYTPVGLLTLRGTMRDVVLAVVWSGAAAAIVLKFVWVSAPKWLSAVIGIGLGWVGVAAMPQVARYAGAAAVALLAAGGVAYTAGAVVYARRRPDPIPAVFGYHELFHALTLVAVSCQYVAIAFFIVKVG